MLATLKSGTESKESMAKASGTHLKGFEEQLATTKLYSDPKDAVAFATSGDLKTTTERVSKFSGIEVEVWEMDEAAFGSFVALIPAPLGIGTLSLSDGRAVQVFSASRKRRAVPKISPPLAVGGPGSTVQRISEALSFPRNQPFAAGRVPPRFVDTPSFQ